MEIGVFTKIWNGLDLDNIFEIMVDNDIFYTQFKKYCIHLIFYLIYKYQSIPDFLYFLVNL